MTSERTTHMKWVLASLEEALSWIYIASRLTVVLVEPWGALNGFSSLWCFVGKRSAAFDQEFVFLVVCRTYSSLGARSSGKFPFHG